jgi:hypothetical protein
MLIFDLITQEEIDDLPDDDPQAAFMTFVRIAQRRLGEQTAKLDPTDQYELGIHKRSPKWIRERRHRRS